MKNRHYAQAIAAQSSLCACVLTACQAYEPYTQEDVFRGAYERNFVKTFGPIAPGQHWDFVQQPASRNPFAQPASGLTRALDDGFVSVYQPSGRYEVDENFFNEIINHTDFTEMASSSFALQVNENDHFEVVPLFQTSMEGSGLKWVLQVIVDGENITSNAQYQGWLMGTSMYARQTGYVDYSAISTNKECKKYGVYSTTPICTIDNREGGKKLMYLNLLVIDYKYSSATDYSKYASPGTQQSSLNYQMQIIDIPHPQNVNPDYQTLFIACEAANFDPSVNVKLYRDKRYQSLVLMLVGPQVPTVVDVKTDEQGNRYVENVMQSKRYMIEDMGSASDFDFNDIVVDVVQSGHGEVRVSQEKVSGKMATKVGLEMSPEVLTHAYVRNLCGIKPFQLSIGNRTFGIVSDPMDREQTAQQLQDEEVSQPEYYDGSESVEEWGIETPFLVTGWNPQENNISVKVWQSGLQNGTDGGWVVQFPKDGKVPYIMALPDKIRWNHESEPFTDWKKFVPAYVNSEERE